VQDFPARSLQLVAFSPGGDGDLPVLPQRGNPKRGEWKKSPALEAAGPSRDLRGNGGKVPAMEPQGGLGCPQARVIRPLYPLTRGFRLSKIYTRHYRQ
jgi:hypothetical protein